MDFLNSRDNHDMKHGERNIGEMGRFVNPDNSAFQVAVNSEIYVDKTGLLEYTNKVLGTTDAYICNSRPRRFGKSYTANMLTAYYSKGCKSKEIFSELAISKNPYFEKHLNKYDVIHIDIQWFWNNCENVDSIVSFISQSVLNELREIYPGVLIEETITLPDGLSRIKDKTGQKFIVIVDEWDVLIRDMEANPRIQEEYIVFLRGMFKGTEPTKFLQLAFLTGILPIKKLETQSALNNFEEFTMLEPDMLSSYFGFTEDEVKGLCITYNQDYKAVKRWYDGYILGEYQIYNPKAVVSVMLRGIFRSYWSKTGTYESILSLISMDFDGLRSAIIEMLSGASIEVDITTFQNDMVSFQNKDDVITLLIHLGYLAYEQNKRVAFVPNEEIRQELLNAIKTRKWDELITFQKESKELLEATWDMDCKKVAEGIEKIHMQFISAIQYNDENSLSSVLTIGYLSSMQYYFKPIQEFPTGRGFVDFVYIPKPEYRQDYPALVVELKWNKNVKTALQQIKDRKYPASILDYTGNILLVGINYDKNSKEHQCIIEKYIKL